MNSPQSVTKICVCARVTRDDIFRAVSEGCHTYRQLVRKTGAGTGCGCCASDVKAVLQEALSEIKEGQPSLNL
ncbi:MAG: (2Fe-2S)-binding protein [Spirochaetia bacterium]|nr:(2Fe-2S)-binding protein [Spirochaetia bacterium]